MSLTAAEDTRGYAFVVRNSAAMPTGVDGADVFVHGAKGETSDGSGFGLAIIQQLSEASGLKIDWQSDADVGTVFTVLV